MAVLTRNRFAIAVLLLWAGTCCAHAGLLREFDLAGRSMGTTWSAKLVVRDALEPKAAHALIQRELDQVEQQMSHWNSASTLSRFNRAAAGTVHQLPYELSKVLDYMLQLSARSNGAFDPTVGALVNLWGFGPRGGRAQRPSASEVAEALQVTGWQQLAFDARTRRITQPGGVELDLSAAAPGFAVDQVVAALQRIGVQDLLLDLGAELRAHGRRADGSPWRIAIQRPPDDDRGNDRIVLQDRAMGASGDYEHHAEYAGKRYSHTLDARTGFPVTHGLAATHVLAATCIEADALASLLSVLGPIEGQRHALEHRIAARLVTREGRGFTTWDSPEFERVRASTP